MISLPLGKATIHASVYEQDMGGGFPGTCEWSIEAGQLRKLIASFPALADDSDINEGIGNAVERIGDGETESLETMQDDESVSFNSADAGIKLLACMGQIGGEWPVTWNGEGETWFFHDIEHARNDVLIEGDDVPTIYIDAQSEERAQVNGARAALAHGVPIDEVVESVVSILDEFESRFSYRPALLARIFHGFKVANA